MDPPPADTNGAYTPSIIGPWMVIAAFAGVEITSKLIKTATTKNVFFEITAKLSQPTFAGELKETPFRGKQNIVCILKVVNL